MVPIRIFISHSSLDKEFAHSVANELRKPAMAPWIDRQEIVAGDDIIDRLGEGLRSMDVLLFLISRASLESGWANLELKYAIRREISEKRVLVMPFIIDDTPLVELPWFLAHKSVLRTTKDAAGAADITSAIRRALERRAAVNSTRPEDRRFQRDPRVEQIISRVKSGHWNAAREAALEILHATDEFGNNELFEHVLKYHELRDDDELRWGAIMTIESFLQLAPSFVNRALLVRMASHQDFSIRSSAASICMDLAQFAPHQVPIDVLVKLAVHDEDWYVMAPATAALKAMARYRPAVLSIFMSRLRSDARGARSHAAEAIADIARKEPEILDPEELASELGRLKKLGDEVAQRHIAEALSAARKVDRVELYRYGL
jgi:hypothetical protein